ncbi:MAG: DNA-3-methyladenine glycosylase 2 family protein [Hyphomicrobiaceae bacterium]
MAAKRTTALRCIETEADIRKGIRSLRRKCAVIRLMHDHAGDPPLRRRPAGFEGLARIIVGQQLSVASAAAIWSRTAEAVKPFEPVRLLAVSETDLRAAGLSRPKIRTLLAAANRIVDTDLDLTRLDHLPEEEIHEVLTCIPGVGPWTSDIFQMFCLGRPDAFASGDLALQVALQIAMDLEARPTAKELAEFAERWRPWRGVAARLLWAYYAVAKMPKSGVPV